METEKRYVIKWEIDTFASSPLEAVQKAIMAMPTLANEDSIATVFTVEEIDINTNEIVSTEEIDLLEGEL